MGSERIVDTEPKNRVRNMQKCCKQTCHVSAGVSICEPNEFGEKLITTRTGTLKIYINIVTVRLFVCWLPFSL